MESPRLPGRSSQRIIVSAFRIIRPFVKLDVQQQIADLLALIRDLTEPATRADSAAELFTASFCALDDCVPFDLAVAVMPETHLDLYVVTREGAAPLVNDHLVAVLRQTPAASLPVPFARTDLISRTDAAPPARAGEGDRAAPSTSVV